MEHEYPAVLKYWFNYADCAFWYKHSSLTDMRSLHVTRQLNRCSTWNRKNPHFSLTIISVTVQLWI